MGDTVIVVPRGTKRVWVDRNGTPWGASPLQWHGEPLVIQWSPYTGAYPPLHLPNGTVVVVVARGTPQYWEVLLARTEAMAAMGEIHPASTTKL